MGKLNKVTIHYSVGRYSQTFNDYHYMIKYDPATKKASVWKGIYKPEDNENCMDGKYAPHCRLANTGNIGVSFCAMYGYKSPKDVGKYPITREQAELMFELVAELCVKYKIDIKEVKTHYERDRELQRPSGKIDIIYLPPFPDVSKERVGAFIRNKVEWYMQRKKGQPLKYV